MGGQEMSACIIMTRSKHGHGVDARPVYAGKGGQRRMAGVEGKHAAGNGGP